MSSATEQPDPGLQTELLGDEPVRRRRDQKPEPEWIVVHEQRQPWHTPRWLWWVLAMALVVTGSGLVFIGAAMDNYLRPALASTHGARQLHLADLMSGPARRALPGVQRADQACNAVKVKPWHFSLVARRNAATAYSGALLTLLQAVASQGRAYFHHDPALVRLKEAAGLDSSLR